MNRRLGRILLAADEEGLTGPVVLKDRKYFARSLRNEHRRKRKFPCLEEPKRWLDLYLFRNQSRILSVAFAFSWHRFPEKGLGDPLRHPPTGIL